MGKQKNITFDPLKSGKTTEKWWKTDGTSKEKMAHPRQGEACPKCYLADLEYDTLFRLHCPNCGYVAECGAFT